MQMTLDAVSDAASSVIHISKHTVFSGFYEGATIDSHIVIYHVENRYGERLTLWLF